MVNIAVAGATGRMGRMLIEAVAAHSGFRLSGALVRLGSAAVGQDATAFLGRTSGVIITDQIDVALQDARILIDFTVPAATLAHCAACALQGTAMVIGTTGLSDADKKALAAAARRIGIVFSPNMSVGVNLVFKLLAVAAAALDESYDVEIVEAHHREKRDAPSGTALRMGEVIAKARGSDLKDWAVFGRQGTDARRAEGSIGFAALRGGDIVGDHTALFAGAGERIEITHRSASRATYAQGSLRAAQFLAGKPPGLYDMQDVLGLS
jgi:4-hydroxy-tetrahydrodipicolinate reductase